MTLGSLRHARALNRRTLQGRKIQLNFTHFFGEVTKITKQCEPLKPIEEWIEKWGADLGGVAQVMLRIAVIEAIEKNVGREKVECDGCCQCQKDFDMRGEWA